MIAETIGGKALKGRLTRDTKYSTIVLYGIFLLMSAIRAFLNISNFGFFAGN